MNNKGFAVTGVLYGVLILFLTLLALILFNLQGKKVILDKQKKDVSDKVSSKVPQSAEPEEPTPVVVAPTAKTIEHYTGNAQELVIAGTTTIGELQYKVGDGSFSTSLPTGTIPGTYTVFYRVLNNGTASNEGHFDVTIPGSCEDKCGVNQDNGATVCVNYNYNESGNPYCNINYNSCTINGNTAGGQFCGLMANAAGLPGSY